MLNVFDVASLVLVGAFWGCTNPLLRKGSASVETEKRRTTGQDGANRNLFLFCIFFALSKIRNVGVWVPYLLNQCGSLIYYKLLSHLELTLAVPICNALALVFSGITSFALGERVDKPWRAMTGASLVILGVAVCISSNTAQDNFQQEGETKMQPSQFFELRQTEL
jgi:drug/metabolite transporter (DMT)-like permease